MSSPLFVQDSISRAQSASPFPWSPTQDGFTIPSISSVRSVQGSPDRVQFRFKRRFCILTYSQVPPDFPHERISEGIHRDGGLCTVSRELHKDGGTHYHAFVDYQRVRDWTGQSRWDVAGHHQTSHQYHGLHTRLLNTCRKIATSRMTALTNQTDRDATLDVLKEMANASGQRSYLHQTKTAFLNHSRKMIRVLWWFVTETSDNTLGGDTPLNDDIMNRLPGSPSESTSTKESKRSLHESDSEVGTFYCRAAPPAPAMRGQPVPPAPLCGT